MSLSQDIAEKSVQAAIASIEIYNKPDFSFREEAFSLLMTNAWELLLKAKWLAGHDDEITCLYDISDDGQPRLSRSGNPCTHSLAYLAVKLFEDKNSGFDKPTHGNVMALIEIRDSSAHFIHKDLQLGRRVLEIGTASLQNYLQLVGEWFQIDLSRYNFFLMPLSFYHGFEAITTSVSPQSVQIQRLLDYLSSLEAQDEGQGPQYVAIRFHTRFVRSHDDLAIPFKWTDDPGAPAVQLTEEDVLKNYPLTYKDLTSQLRKRYEDFIENRKYHEIRHRIEQAKKYSIIRTLNPRNPKSVKQRFYNANIIAEFDKHYQRRKKGEQVVAPDWQNTAPVSP